MFSAGMLFSLSVSSSSLSQARRANLLLFAALAHSADILDCFQASWVACNIVLEKLFAAILLHGGNCDCFAHVVASRNRAGVICLHVSLSLSVWWLGRVKETFRGTVLPTNALLYNLVRWAIG